MQYIWQETDWPDFCWDTESITQKVEQARLSIGRLLGLLEAAGFETQQNAELATLTTTIDTSGKMEGENLGTEEIRSSVARRLGLDNGGLLPVDRHIDGVVEMMMDATRNCAKPLTDERLFGWQAALFPTGRSGIGKIRTGAYRDDSEGPMRVISGPKGREKIHYEAPPANRIQEEMKSFLEWFNSSSIDPLLKSPITHLRFVTIHPFDDGNGRLARAIADMARAQADQSPMRFYSITAEIKKERARYYEILDETQKGNLDITRWILWYLDCLENAISATRASLRNVRDQADFWARANRTIKLNRRQNEILRMMLGDFKGHMTTSKWAALCKCSQDTAGRDISALVEAGLLARGTAGGRSTWYDVVK